MIFAKTNIGQRYPGNPIITPADLPCRSNAVFNSGCIQHDDRYHMMLRIEDVDEARHFRMAFSRYGIRFDIAADPVQIPDSEDIAWFEWLRYDPRITPLEGTFYVTYAAHGTKGVRVCIVQTDDFVRFRRIHYISQPDNRNGLVYRCRAMLLDLEHPEKVIARSNGYILGPQESYERVGDIPNVVLVTGNVLEPDGTVKFYYGAADTVMCLAFVKLTDLIAAAREQ